MHPNKAMIDLAALRHNIGALRHQLPNNVIFMAVMKANAYGHGVVPIAKEALHAGAGYLGVAMVSEGVALRESGVSAPILVMGGAIAAYAPDIVAYDLEATVYTRDALMALETEAAAAKKHVGIHIEYDTGMNRIGITSLAELQSLLRALQGCGHVNLCGLSTHFAVSEIEDKTFTQLQADRFIEAASLVRSMGLHPLLHAANSGALLDMPDTLSFDMVRAGIAMYGYHPGPGCGRRVLLRPVLRLTSLVNTVKTIRPGDTVSYGRTYTAPKDRRIATIPIGYGDGYMRCMSHKANVLLHGKRAPVVGVICMDQLMVDVSDIINVAVGDEAVLIGSQGGDAITAEDLAEWAGTIPYEVLLAISPRVPRINMNGTCALN
ncbi:MAG: alanine racemase [Clostridiales bacterium]|jgi:alanine racemase|nr:alanine racemase [Clostridiales bacterium]